MTEPTVTQATETLDVAVLVPCFQEEAAIGAVVDDFRRALPRARIHVYDNNSTDRTAEVAAQHGAIVRHEPLQGKGNVLRRMFADIEADVYVMVDGDGTYDAASAVQMIEALVAQGADMVTAVRVSEEDGAYRAGHRFGNRALTRVVGWVFGNRASDMLSGYRALSRRFVKSFPALSSGFEIETELTVHALELRMPLVETPTPYRARARGTHSKLRTFRDGFRILWMIVRLLQRERPLQLYAATGLLLAVLSVVLAIPLFVTYLQTGLVPRFPTAILCSAIMLLAFLSLTAGLVLDTVTHGRREDRRLAYLQIPGIAAQRDRRRRGRDDGR